MFSSFLWIWHAIDILLLDLILQYTCTNKSVISHTSIWRKGLLKKGHWNPNIAAKSLNLDHEGDYVKKQSNIFSKIQTIYAWGSQSINWSLYVHVQWTQTDIRFLRILDDMFLNFRSFFICIQFTCILSNWGYLTRSNLELDILIIPGGCKKMVYQYVVIKWQKSTRKIPTDV
jgi:hypothetical protein